jgi:hypothetical protein
MKTKQYGKSSSALLNQKTSFFDENQKHLEKQKDIASIYLKQPRRNYCKNCASPADVGEKGDFLKDGIEYFICNTCNHLNGAYEDTTAFCKALYTENTGEKYAENYSVKEINDYNYRTTSIYLPKAEFLFTTLLANKINPHTLQYLDLGAGTGYFVAALKKMGLKQIQGTEVSKTQVDLGNNMIGEELLKIHKLENTNMLLRETTAQVISMIGVLEHLQHPREALEEIKNNNNIKFLYISVPTYSLSVYLEMLSPDIFHRHLSGAHTHLYTEKSLNYLANEFDFKIIGEWWFGSDIVDLFRHLKVNMIKMNTSNKAINMFSEEFIPVIDSLQLEIDKKHYSSEVHMLFQKK